MSQSPVSFLLPRLCQPPSLVVPCSYLTAEWKTKKGTNRSFAKIPHVQVQVLRSRSCRCLFFHLPFQWCRSALRCPFRRTKSIAASSCCTMRVSLLSCSSMSATFDPFFVLQRCSFAIRSLTWSRLVRMVAFVSNLRRGAHWVISFRAGPPSQLVSCRKGTIRLMGSWTDASFGAGHEQAGLHSAAPGRLISSV